MSPAVTPLHEAPSRREQAFEAYQRHDDDALQLLRTAMKDHPMDGGLLIAEATLAQEIGLSGARDRLLHVLTQAPDWLDGHVALARLRWGIGDRDHFLGTIEVALKALSRHTGLWMRYMTLLADSGQPGHGADVAAQLRRTGGDGAALRLIEAQHAAADGQLERAGALIETLPAAFPGLAYAKARHRLQIGDPAASVPLLDLARVAPIGANGAWALTELAWRATGDPRHAWLLDADTMVRAFMLDGDDSEIVSLVSDLRTTHARRWSALGQSARGATQTRGNLRDLAMPSITLLFERLDGVVADYIAALQPADAAHPLLAHRDKRLAITDAWSIRMCEGGHHVGHVHPDGVISSACHLAVPAHVDTADRAGWLELGRPPADIDLAIAPVAEFRPIPGQVVLFPSYLYHGTRALDGGERISVAFDVGSVCF